MWGQTKTQTAQAALPDLTASDVLTPNVFHKGWIHLIFDDVPTSQMQDGTLTLPLKDATGKKHYVISVGPRASSGDVWPKDLD